jgi:hypothetical protein
MDLSSYRCEYAAFCSSVERERYRHHAGLAPELRRAPIRERYSDLWTRESIDELQRKLADTSADFETERASLQALVCAACLNHLEAHASDVTEELTHCEDAAHIVWGGEKIKASDAPTLISHESDFTRRRELAARWLDALLPCDDLRAARLEALADTAQTLGYAGLRALHEDATGASLDTLASGGDQFLARTAPAYHANLSRWAAQNIPGAGANALSFADELFFRRAPHLNPYFPPARARTVYSGAMAGLGVKVEQQHHVRIDSGERPGSKPHAACFGVEPPSEIYLVEGAAGGGASSYVEFFFEAGRAQHFAWSSAETASRYPEFIHATDEAARDGAGFLLAGLFRDEAWVGEHLNLRPVEARELARSVALLELEGARRDCAAMRFAIASDEASDLRSEQLSETYVSLHTDATGFRHDHSMRLNDSASAFDSATRLRARLLAASLREHLRSRYGRRWHASRAAGDELIDIWNTASRYHAEELARLAWGGELDFEILAEELKATLEGE